MRRAIIRSRRTRRCFSTSSARDSTTAQIGKTHWTAGPAWHEQFKNSGAFFKALGLDHVADISGPPDSTKGRDPYSQHLQKLGLLQAVADDLHGRYVKGEFEPRASVVKAEDYHDVFTTGLAVDFIRAQPKEKPLCLVVSLHSPHPPLDAPGDYATMFDPEKLTLPANVPAKYLREGRALDHAEDEAHAGELPRQTGAGG